MPKPVIHDHDGHVDDILSCILLWLSADIDLQAVGITNGDCYADQAFEAILKMATYLDIDGPEIAWNDDPVPNPFPDNWRRESYIINELPLFGDIYLKKLYQQGKGRRSEEAFADCLAHSKEPLTIVATGPLTVLAPLMKNPDLRKKVAEIVVMGGAIQVPGNVEEGEHDGSAEWNVYADPVAFKQVLDTGVQVKMIPLDVTNQVPVTKEFLQRLEDQSSKYKASMLAAKLWSLVKGFTYYFWDTITAAAAIKPELFTFKDMRIEIATQGKSMGKTSSVMFGGKKIQVATGMDKEAFEELLLEIFRAR
ncbi:MAG: nucleoside hydrolase [Cyanobacteria bacterium SZAS-4]|nr:nucleoside hydrolase [Cyanobacteria bacterium SZAS-4]